MVYAVFRSARLRQDIPDPPQLAPEPHYEEKMDARPDEEEMEQAINTSLQLLEKQEKRGFKDLATLLRARSLLVCGRGYVSWFSPSTGRRSGLYVKPVGVAPVPTRSGPQVTNRG